MKKIRSIVALLLVAVMLGTTALAVQFPDVDPYSTVGKAVDYLSNIGVLGGMDDGTFQPNATITRAQFSKIIYMLQNQGTSDPNADAYKGNSAFFDVAAEQWFSGYVNWAYQNKIIGGMGDGTFAPDNTLTYAQAIKMYVVAAGVDDSGFSYPNDYITKATELGILDNVYLYSPDAGATRGDIAVMGYNKIMGGGDPTPQKPAPYRLCAQAPDFGEMFGVSYNYKSEDTDAIFYTYPQVGNYQTVGEQYSAALRQYGYSYDSKFTDNSGNLVNVYTHPTGYVAMFSCNSREVTVMITFPDGQPCNPFVSAYYVEYSNVPDFGYYAKVPVRAIFDNLDGVYYYDALHYNFSIDKANSYMDVLESSGFPYMGNVPVDGVVFRTFSAKDGFIAVGMMTVSGERNFVVMVLPDADAASNGGLNTELAAKEIKNQLNSDLIGASSQKYNYYKTQIIK